MSRRALIVGMGIGGMSAAIALKKRGWAPVIVERASERRRGGYFIGLQNDGKQAAQALGVLDAMQKRTPRARFWDIRRDGSRRQIADITNETNAPIAVLRGDIEDALWQSVEGEVEVRFDTTPTAIVDESDGARVKLVQGEKKGTPHETEEVFDLVIGADGVRSSVRKMVFGPDEDFFDYVGTVLCAFPLSRPLPGVEKSDGIIMSEVGRSLTVFPLADRPSTALLSYRADDINAQFAEPHLEVLRKKFAGFDNGGLLPQILEDLSKTDDYLFDSVQMVKMPEWHKGHVVLLGDSAWCLTLYSGMGASAALMGGQRLGEALSNHPENISDALKEYGERMRPFVDKHQKMISLRSQLFVPSSAFFLAFRRVLWKVLGWLRNRDLRKRD
ncbi:hypothetical protein LMG33818_001483 [Halomonadaceae bacterium LMG 33818]|uniref:FAD-dependent monooxygenase n=1 Tax=Cernens ardua TaxID=3402176 RepID=UPI003EDB781E